MIKKNAKIWNVLANDCETPGEFISNVMSLRKETPATVSKKIGTSDSYIRLVTNNKCIPATKACYKIATALDIDPYLLNRVTSDYAMKTLIENNES